MSISLQCSTRIKKSSSELRARPEPDRRPLGRQVGRVGVVVIEEGEVRAAAVAAAVQPAEERVVDQTGVLAVGCHEPSEDRMKSAHPGREARPCRGVPREPAEDGGPQRTEVRQVEGVVLVMGETAVQAGVVGAILDVADEAGRLVAPRGRGTRPAVGNAVRSGACQPTPSSRGQRPVKKLACEGSVQGADRPRLVEADAARGQSLAGPGWLACRSRRGSADPPGPCRGR